MTKIYSKSEGHKKILVPVIALLLCATALIGAGYAALASTASNTGNELSGDIVVLDVSNGDERVSISADYYVDFGHNANGDIYMLKEFQVGHGVLKINVKNFKGGTVNLVSEAILEENAPKWVEHNEYGFEIRIGENEEDSIELDLETSDILQEVIFEVWLVSKKVTEEIKHVGSNINGIILEIPGGEEPSQNANFNIATELPDDFKYTVNFSVFPVNSVDDESEDDNNG